MKVAAVQFKARPDFSAGLRELVARVDAAAQGADLVVCPEMALRGYAWTSRADVLRVAEQADGPTARALGAIARDRKCWIVCGIPERARDRVFNAALVLDPSGEVAFVYRKTLLFEADLAWADPGDSGYRAFEAEGFRFGVGICMDLNDDRFLAWAHRARVDALALPTNWVQEEGVVADYWRQRLLAGWAPELGFEGTVPGRARVDAALVAANGYGREGAYLLSGRSAVLTWRRVFAQAGPAGDATISADPPRPGA